MFFSNITYNFSHFRKILEVPSLFNPILRKNKILYNILKKSSFNKSNNKLNNKKFKKVRSNPLIFKLYNLIFYGRTYNILFDKSYYKRYNIIYQKLINLLYSIKNKLNYKKVYKNLYNILFFNNKYILKYKKLYSFFGKIYNKILNKRFYKKSKGLYFLYKIFNKIYNKIFYLLFLAVRIVKKDSKKYLKISNKIFEYIKVYNKTVLNYKYYNFYKNLIDDIKNKYRINNKDQFIDNLKTKYDHKFIYYRNLVFNNKFIIKTFNNKYSKKYFNKLKISNKNYNNKLSYYDYFIKDFSKKKNLFLFNINKPFVLSSYQVYNIKFYYSPISFDPKIINKKFIKAIKRFCNVYSISILNLFFNQYMHFNKFSKNYIVKFVMVFLNKFH